MIYCFGVSKGGVCETVAGSTVKRVGVLSEVVSSMQRGGDLTLQPASLRPAIADASVDSLPADCLGIMPLLHAPPAAGLALSMCRDAVQLVAELQGEDPRGPSMWELRGADARALKMLEDRGAVVATEDEF